MNQMHQVQSALSTSMVQEQQPNNPDGNSSVAYGRRNI